jgi:hypothetical protein
VSRLGFSLSGAATAGGGGTAWVRDDRQVVGGTGGRGAIGRHCNNDDEQDHAITTRPVTRYSDPFWDASSDLSSVAAGARG